MNDPENIETGTIWVESYVSNEDFKGYVRFKWGKEGGKLTPSEARRHAFFIMAAADAAESDAFLVDFFMQGEEVRFPDALKILRAFRAYRDKERLKSGPPAADENP